LRPFLPPFPIWSFDLRKYELWSRLPLPLLTSLPSACSQSLICFTGNEKNQIPLPPVSLLPPPTEEYSRGGPLPYVGSLSNAAAQSPPPKAGTIKYYRHSRAVGSRQIRGLETLSVRVPVQCHGPLLHSALSQVYPGD